MRIFISHSSRGDDHAGNVREQLSDRLKDRYEVLVDMDALRPGDEWCATLYRWLGEADAAIVLINQRALDSLWVRREVNILLWRRALNRSFRVVPVLLGDVTEQDLDAHGFDELRPVQMELSGHDPGVDAATLAERIASRFLPAPARVSDPMAVWLRSIAGFLAQSESTRFDELEQAARLLGISEAEMSADWTWEGSHLLLAAQMLGEGLWESRLERAVATLSGAFTRRDALQGLVNAVKPSWVDSESARLLLPPAASANERVLILNAWRQQIAVDYLYRATCNARYGYQFIMAVCDGVGEDGEGELAARFDDNVRDALGIDDWSLGDDVLRDPRKIYYLFVGVGKAPLPMVAGAVRLLHRDHPWLVVVLLTGTRELAPDELRDADLAEATAIRPPLRPGAEARAGQLVRALDELPARIFEMTREAA